MWTHSILPILLCLQTAAAIPFVTNASIGVSYQGTSANGVEQFQNISYAEDTSGANRFAPPVPFLPARGSTIQATAAGAACPQNASIADLPIETLPESISEDCLTLRIARPANHSTDKPLPVMVWIYGGTADPPPHQLSSIAADIEYYRWLLVRSNVQCDLQPSEPCPGLCGERPPRHICWDKLSCRQYASPPVHE